MENNVGGLDQGVRITLGPLLLVAAIGSMLGSVKLRPSLAAVAGVAGAVLTVTGLTRTCPANSALGRDTSESDLSEEARSVRERAIQ